MSHRFPAVSTAIHHSEAKVTTTIISGIKDVRVQVSYDTLLEKYCLQIGTNSGLVEFLISWDLMQGLSDQLLAFVVEGEKCGQSLNQRRAS